MIKIHFRMSREWARLVVDTNLHVHVHYCFHREQPELTSLAVILYKLNKNI